MAEKCCPPHAVEFYVQSRDVGLSFIWQTIYGALATNTFINAPIYFDMSALKLTAIARHRHTAMQRLRKLQRSKTLRAFSVTFLKFLTASVV
jgi:hypothetical protein